MKKHKEKRAKNSAEFFAAFFKRMGSVILEEKIWRSIV